MKQTILGPDYWDTFYRNGNDWGQPWSRILVITRNLQRLFSTPAIRVLDLACGNGRYTIPLARLGACVDCIDFSEVAIMQVRAQAEEQDIGHLIKPQCINVREFPIKPRRYHLVLASGLFEYLAEAELYSVIRDVQAGTIVQGINVFVYLLQHPQATTIVGEYPLASGIIENLYKSSPTWQIILSEEELKVERHPLEQDGKPQWHKHYVGRMIARKVAE